MNLEIERLENGADFPQHESPETSSIGGVGEPQPASFKRLKGFHIGDIVDSDRQFSLAWNEFLSGVEQLSDKHTRVQHRLVATDQFLRHNIDKRKFWTSNIEVIAPLDNGLRLVYLAHNLNTRRSHPSDSEVVSANIEDMLTCQPRSLDVLRMKARENDCLVEILYLPESDIQRNTVIDQMFNLYSRFGWDRKEVIQLLENPNNTIAVARCGDDIVSAGIAEKAEIRVGKNKFTFVEITEAATHAEFVGKGLYAAVSTELLLSLQGKGIDFTFGECNGMSRGVLRVARYQSRTSSIATTRSYDLENRGILHQQVPINDPLNPNRQAPYNDLVVMSLSNSQLEQQII